MGRMNLLNNIVNPANNQVEGFCVVKSVAIKSNVKGSDYLDMILADAGGEISAKLWDYSIEQHGVYEPDSIIKVRATVNIWKDSEQLKLDRIRAARDSDNVDMSSLVPCAPLPPQEMYDEIIQVTESLRTTTCACSPSIYSGKTGRNCCAIPRRSSFTTPCGAACSTIPIPCSGLPRLSAPYTKSFTRPLAASWSMRA